MLEGDEDGDDRFFVFGLVNIDAIFIMNGEHFLGDNGDDVFAGIVELKIKTKDVATKLPAESLDVRDIFVDMEDFVG